MPCRRGIENGTNAAPLRPLHHVRHGTGRPGRLSICPRHRHARFRARMVLRLSQSQRWHSSFPVSIRFRARMVLRRCWCRFLAFISLVSIRFRARMVLRLCRCPHRSGSSFNPLQSADGPQTVPLPAPVWLEFQSASERGWSSDMTQTSPAWSRSGFNPLQSADGPQTRGGRPSVDGSGFNPLQSADGPQTHHPRSCLFHLSFNPLQSADGPQTAGRAVAGYDLVSIRFRARMVLRRRAETVDGAGRLFQSASERGWSSDCPPRRNLSNLNIPPGVSITLTYI